ncbi:MAG: amino acid adenylation domain-containing protein [Nitrospira sp.]|nr:amino acid adenylation domain-containing protein [Nitrospira sp.]
MQYADFAIWQREWLQGKRLKDHMVYWRHQLAGAPPMLQVPTDFTRPAVPTYRGRRQPVAFSEKMAHALHEISEREGVTLFMVMLAAFQVLLARYTGQFDVVVGTPIANRSQEKLELVNGFFANTLVLRTDLSGHPTFQEVLGRVRNVCLGAYAHQDVPFEKLVEELEPERDISRNPLFQVMFQLYTPHDPGVTIPNLAASRQILDSGTAKFDLLFSLGDRGGGLYGGVEYATDLFEEATILRLIGHYQRLLEEIIADPTQKVDQLPFLTDAENNQLTVQWNATETAFAKDRCVHELVEEQARQTPDSIAIVFGEEAVTYTRLNHQANILARHLQHLGVGPDIPVGVCVERSVDMLVAVLAVLKAGGAYVPLDPTYPRARLTFMLTNADVSVLVTQRRFQDLFTEAKVHHVWIDETLIPFREPFSPVAHTRVTPTNLAYVIYTSGSTGQPKGVAMTHQAIVNLLAWQHRHTTVPVDARTLQFTSLNFDVSVQEIFATLGFGGTLVLMNETQRQEPVSLLKLLITAQVERLFLPVVALNQLAEIAEFWELIPTGIQEIITAGEALQITHSLRRFVEKLALCTLHNQYGPTESHVSTAYTLKGPCKDWPPRPPIGRPIANEEAYVLDKWLHPVPIGVTGELLLGGVGLARGYINRTDLTAERFVPSPFNHAEGQRLYRTGDLVRYHPDGALEFLGRIDHQIKLRGYRIETGEIEIELEQHPGVSKAVVVVREEAGQQQLVAYVAPSPASGIFEPLELQRFLGVRLPAYMIPSAWVMLNVVPLTPTGKVDRRALPAPRRVIDESNQFVPPETPKEELLAKIWGEVLKVERVGRQDNFFELGGHSLLAMKLISRIRKVFGEELSIRKLFEAPTIEELGVELGKRKPTELGEILPIISRKHLPLSFAQQRLWFLEHWEPNSALYNVSSVFRLRGPLRVDALRAALAALVARHESLRTVFPVVDDLPYQHIPSLTELAYPTLTLTEVPDEAEKIREATLLRLITEETQRPFNLTRGPLARAHLLRVAETEAVFVLTLHHIITDGWSMEILLKELSVLYAAELTGTPASLPALPCQYADFVIWQRNWLQGDVLADQVTYWRRQLDGAPPVLELPTDYPRPVVPSYRGAKHQFTFPAELTQALHIFSHRSGISLFMTLLAAFQVFLARYTGQTDIVVGSPMANRTHPASEGLIGLLVNTLLFRTRLPGNPTFAEVVARVKEVCLNAYAHQDLPFEKLVEELQPERDPGRNPLFQVMLQLQTQDGQDLTLPGLEIERLPNRGGLAKFDLNLTFVEADNALKGVVDYRTDLFAAATITRMMTHFYKLVQALVANPEQPVFAVELLTEAERRQQLVDWNAPTTSYPLGACVHHLFEAQAARIPEAIAVVFESQSLTYQEINGKANRLSRQLQQQGVLRGDVVPVVMERSVELIISYLAIMKIGAAFSPLDPAWPPERLRTLLTQLSSPVVLANQDPAGFKNLWAGKKVMEVDAAALSVLTENVNVPVQSEDPIYVLFTSGSTGVPKGAINHHRGIVNRLWNMQQRYPWSEDDVVLLTLRHTFDASIWQCLWPLTHGARLVLPSPTPWLEMVIILQLIEQERITLTGFVPSVFALLADEVEQQPLLPTRLDSLRHLLIGGEALHALRVNQFRRCCPGVRITNAYGPTEASISTIYHEVPDPCSDPIPIGRPLKNVKAVILDDHLNLVPVGVPGELHLGGVCVGFGYLNNPRATQAVFIPNPFPELNTSTLYKTGDRACFQEDGTIRYLGRRDHQIKINGIRMELGEIEVVLRRHPEVKQAVVHPWAMPSGGKRLVAYVVGTPTNASLEKSKITNFLSQYLPTYMIPSTFMLLEQLPRLPNGKINRHALPAPPSSTSQSEIVIPPQTSDESRLAKIFSEILKVEVIGRHDNFFALGGHSLLAMMMVSRIQKIFGIKVGVRVLFDHPTIATLASFFTRQTVKSPGQNIAKHTRGSLLPLSFAQQRLWFLEQWDPDTSLYNIPKVFRLCGTLNVSALQRALDLLVFRHETLRMTFTSEDGIPSQLVGQKSQVDIIYHDLREWTPSTPHQRARELADKEAERPFNLSRGPLFRVMLLELSSEEHWLSLTLPHIIADGWSMEILWRDLGKLYQDCLNGRTPDLPPLALQYGDFAIWEREWSQGAEYEKQRAYWRQKLENVPTVLDLPTDHPRPLRQSYRGGHQRFSIPALLTSKLKSLCQREGLTMFMLLIGVYQVLLYRYSGQRDMVVGTPVARRPLDEVEGLIGLFINTILIRSQFDGNPTFRRVVLRLKETCLDAYANRDLPFENLIKELQSNRDPSRNPLFQVLFHLYTPLDNLQRFPGLDVREEAVYRGTAKVDLAMTLTDSGSSIQGSVEYATDLFEARTIDRFIQHFTQLIEEVVANPDQRIDSLPLLSSKERHQLVETWNNTATDYPSEVCLHDLVQQQALRTPDAIVLVYEEHHITYRELTGRANQLANYLVSLGVGPEVRVGLCHERAPELIIGLLGILQAGGAYVPLDPTYPLERLRFMTQDAQTPVVVTQECLESFFPQESLIKVSLDRDWSMITTQSNRKPSQPLTGSSLAYVLYTSGSTGRPKGVQIEHGKVVNFLLDVESKLKNFESDIVLTTTNLSFDISIFEVFSPLAFGGRLILASQAQIKDGHQLVETLSLQSVTKMLATPAGWRLLLEANWRGKPDLIILTGGEALSEDLAHQLLKRGRALWNLYGPTETTIFSTYTRIAPSEPPRITIGSPIANTQTYIVNTGLQPVPIGVPGELFIGGDGVSRGYLNRPDLTAERFIPDPFHQSRGRRVYRTGDCAKYCENGTIAWLGRLDHQVKLRGFRIELDEIEKTLVQWPTMAQVLVVIRTDAPGKEQLVVYYQIAFSQTSPSIEELKAYLRKQLPEFMVPHWFIQLDKFPLTPNGKIDRTALPAPQLPCEVPERFEPLQTTTEENLAEIWGRVLGIKDIGRATNFFELGGHSLLAMQLISQVRKAFGIEIFVRTLFEAPTVRAFAETVTQLKESQSMENAEPISSKASEDPRVQAVEKKSGNLDFFKPDTPLVCLQPQGTLPPFFYVHPVGGGISCYQELVRYLGKEYPIYALQAIDFIPTLGLSPSLEELAGYYIRSIQSLNPLGPYHLAGWSLGGVIAYEMARQLEAMGQHVEILILIDSFLPQQRSWSATINPQSTLRQFWRNLSRGERIHLTEIFHETGTSQSGQDATLRALWKYGLQHGVLPVGMQFSHIKQLWDVFESLRKALDAYHPKSYSGKLTLFQASAHRTKINKQAQKDWESITQGGVEVYEIPGNHYSIFDTPHIAILASQVNTSLATVTSGGCAQHPESRPYTSKNNREALSSAIVPSHTKMHISQVLRDLPQEFRVEQRPLSSLIKEGEIPPIDSVALYYLSDQYLHESGLTRDAVLHGWYHNQPTITHILDTSIGRIGTLMLPLTGIELYSEQKRLLELSRRGLEIASQAGATTASLTGLLPSATNYGHAIREIIGNRENAPTITTGHGTTAATVVLAIRKILEVSQRDLETECVGFLGLGSIGLASLRLMLSCLPHPEELLLCDLYHRKDALEAIRQEVLHIYDFQGKVRLIESTGIVPKAFYGSRLIIGATNVPDVLDVDRLQPGSLIVDDSGPHCFKAASAIDRATNQRDILFTEGGILRSPTVIPCLRYLPHHAMDQMTPGLAKIFSRFHPWRITGCVLASILLAKVPDQKPVFGLVDVQTGVDNFNTLLKLEYAAAELNCEGYTLPSSLVENVAIQFGHAF